MDTEDTQMVKLGLKIAGWIAIVILVISLWPFVLVGPGERGVVLNWRAVSNEVMGEGLHFRIPIYQDVKIMKVQVVKMEVKAMAYSKDVQTVDSGIALNYQLDGNKVNQVYQQLGVKFEDTIISPAVQESVKAVIAKYTAQELIEKREQVKDEIKASLTERLQDKNIIVKDFSIINFDFSDAFEKANEDKQVARTYVDTAKNKLEQAKFDADARVAQAKGEAEAIKIQVEAITQQGGQDYVALKSVEKWDGVLPVQMIPGGTVPFINLTK